MASVIKSAPSQDLMSELRAFIAGSQRSAAKANHAELTRTALSLLKSLPAARDAVLEYFCTVMDMSVSRYMSQLEVSHTEVKIINWVHIGSAGPMAGRGLQRPVAYDMHTVSMYTLLNVPY